VGGSKISSDIREYFKYPARYSAFRIFLEIS